ncbi:MAG: RNA ligase family protein [Promethearchaeota archaeon]
MSQLIVDVSRISKIESHPNADRLRIATIKGWQCIIGLDDFKENDLVVFIPPDSVLPDELIDKYNLEFVKKGGRIKTVKLRGFISQGLCLPVPEGKNWKEGKSVAEELGITKYEPPRANYQGQPRPTLKSVYLKYREGDITFRRFVAKSIGIIKDSFKPKKNMNPLFAKYTDIENIKNFNTVFTENDEVVITEKIHGTNFRAGYLKRPTKYFWQRWLLKFLGDYEFVYGSHNVQKIALSGKGFYGEDVYGKIAERYKLAEIIPKDYIIYGEIYGKKIQELEYGMDDIDVVFFDLKYQNKYVDYEIFSEFCSEKNLPVVPLLFTGRTTADSLKYFTNGTSVVASRKNVKQMREGCVIKMLKEDIHPRIGRKILKSVSAEYLLSKKRTEHH